MYDIPAPADRLLSRNTGLSPSFRAAVLAIPSARPRLEPTISQALARMVTVADKHGPSTDTADKTLVIGIGCSVGHHRSVSFAEETASRLKQNDWVQRTGWDISVDHRDWYPARLAVDAGKGDVSAMSER